MTTEITLVVPHDRVGCITWLSKQEPNMLADILERVEELCKTVSLPRHEQIQREHEQMLVDLRTEHKHQIELIQVKAEAERDAIQQLLTEIIREDMRGKASPVTPDIAKLITTYYTTKKRLPRNIGDLVPHMTVEERDGIVANPGIFDTTLACVKKEHYKVGRTKTAPDSA